MSILQELPVVLKKTIDLSNTDGKAIDTIASMSFGVSGKKENNLYQVDGFSIYYISKTYYRENPGLAPDVKEKNIKYNMPLDFFLYFNIDEDAKLEMTIKTNRSDYCSSYIVDREIENRYKTIHEMDELQYIFDYVFLTNRGFLDEIRSRGIISGFQTVADFFLAIQDPKIINSFINNLVSSYNYCLVREGLSEDNTLTPLNRFLKIYESSTFQDLVSNSIELLSISIRNKELNSCVYTENPELGFLSSLERYEKELLKIRHEVYFRAWEYNAACETADVIQVRDKYLIKGYESKSYSFISDWDKKYLKEIEDKLMKGLIVQGSEEYQKFQKLVLSIQEQFVKELKTIEQNIRTMNMLPVNESYYTYVSTKLGRKDAISNLNSYISELIKDAKKIDLASVRTVLDNIERQVEKQKLEDKISSLVEDEGEIQLDRDKRAILRKIEQFEDMDLTDPTTSKQLQDFLSSSIPAINNIISRAEILCGIKNTYYSAFDEAQRKELFGEHYQYLSMDKLYEKILEKKQEYDSNIGRDFERTPADGENAYNVLVRDVVQSIDKKSKSLTLNALMNEKTIDSLKLKIKENLRNREDANALYSADDITRKFFNDEDSTKLDVFKILQYRKNLIDRYDFKNNRVYYESKRRVLSEKETQELALLQDVAREIVFIDEQLLDNKVARAEGRMAIDSKDLAAYNATLDSDNGKELADRNEQLSSQIKRLIGNKKKKEEELLLVEYSISRKILFLKILPIIKKQSIIKEVSAINDKLNSIKEEQKNCMAKLSDYLEKIKNGLTMSLEQ